MLSVLEKLPTKSIEPTIGDLMGHDFRVGRPRLALALLPLAHHSFEECQHKNKSLSQHLCFT
jgi:hypothetical protein